MDPPPGDVSDLIGSSSELEQQLALLLWADASVPASVTQSSTQSSTQWSSASRELDPIASTSGRPPFPLFKQENLGLQELREQNAQLLRQNTILGAQYKEIREAYSALVNRVPITPVGMPLQPSDYPRVRFWFKHDWVNSKEKSNPVGNGSQSLRGKARIGQGINVNMCYVEDASGAAVEGNLAGAMRAITRSNWVKFALKYWNEEPSCWGQAAANFREAYFHQMSAMFVELRLCAVDWKAEQIAMDNYPSWHAGWEVYKQQRAAEELEAAADGKRPRQDSITDVAMPKRMRSDNFPGLPIDAGVAPIALSDSEPGATAAYIENFTVDPAYLIMPTPVDDNGLNRISDTVEHSTASGSQSVFASVSAAGPSKQPSKMRPGGSNTARNLCSVVWCQDHPFGTTADFKLHFDNLPREELEKYEKLSMEKRLAGK